MIKAVDGKRRSVLTAASMALGTLIAVLCLWFVIGKLITDWPHTRALLEEAVWAWSLAAVVIATIGMVSLGLVWRSVLAALGSEVRATQVFVWYQIGMLGKYVPGGVFAMMGRAELAHRGGVSRSVAYNSVALSMGATYLAGALVCAALLPFALLDRVAIGEMWWVLTIIPAGFLALHPRVLGCLFLAAERLFGGRGERVIPTWRTSVGLVARYAPGWLLNGLACWLTALCFSSNAPVATLVFAGIASWVAGFLVVFVPSGAGVREAMFVALTAGVLGGPAAAATAVVSRFVFVTADLLAAGIAGVVSTTRIAKNS